MTVHPFSDRRRTTLAMFAVLTAVAGILSTLLVGTAAAATPTIVRSVPLNWCPSGATVCSDGFATPAAPRVTAGRSGVTRVVCSVSGRPVDGSSRWFFVGTTDAGVGFLRNSALANPPAGLPDCTKVPGVEASLWTTALAQYGATAPQADARALARRNYPGTEWTTTDRWSGYCIMFAELAWAHTGTRIAQTGDAAVVWQQVQRWGRSGDRNPPRGALVFWDWYQNGRNYGHAAISLGNGTVMTTQGGPGGAPQPTAIKTITSVTQGKVYRGWWLPRPY